MGLNKQHLILWRFACMLCTLGLHTPHAVGNKFNYTDSAWTWADPTQKKNKSRFSAQGLWRPNWRVQEKWNATHTQTHTHINAYSVCQKVKLSLWLGKWNVAFTFENGALSHKKKQSCTFPIKAHAMLWFQHQSMLKAMVSPLLLLNCLVFQLYKEEKSPEHQRGRQRESNLALS